MTLTLTYYSINTFLRYQIILFIATETHICKQLTKSRHVTVNQARKRSIDCSACSIFTAHQCADARYWHSNSVCLSGCPSSSGIVSKRLSIKHLREIPTGSPLREVEYKFSYNTYLLTYLINWTITYLKQQHFMSTFTNVLIARQHSDARYWYSNSVRLSVRPSVRYVPVFYGNSLTYCHSFFTTR